MARDGEMVLCNVAATHLCTNIPLDMPSSSPGNKNKSVHNAECIEDYGKAYELQSSLVHLFTILIISKKLC